MSYEQKPNTGSLFKNDRRDAESHPHYKGSALIEGVEYWLDAWINTSKDGAKYMSLKLKAKGERTGNGTPTAAPAVITAADLDDSDVPF